MKTSRRKFLKQSVAAGATSLVSFDALGIDVPGRGSSQEAVLENGLMRAVFDTNTGALLGLLNKQTGRQYQYRNELARSFEMVVPLPERLLHIIDGLRQKTSSHKILPNRLDFIWDHLESEYVGRLDIGVVGSAILSDAGLTFEMKIDNKSPYTVESVAWPFIGDLKRPSKGQFRSAFSGSRSLLYSSLAPKFYSQRGYWGTEFPIQMIPTPDCPWILILDDADGLYVGCHDESTKERVEFTFRLKPGYGKLGEVPPGDEISGQAVHLEFFPSHLPFVQPGESYTLSPIVLNPFIGDWHAGVDNYKAWRQSWTKTPYIPKWLRSVHSWQMIQMSTWGDTLKIRYADLPAYAAECARHGVKCIQLVGWTLYGQDGRLPIHDIDPRFGTREELRDAIAKAREMGVYIVLYEKYTSTDKGTDWYKNELYKYTSKDIYGNAHGHEGWRYDMPSFLAGINTRPYGWMCMNSTRWQDIALEEMRKSLDLNPAGIFLDESQSHGTNAFYCFDRSHGHRIPSYNYAGDTGFERKMRKMIEERDPELVLGGENPYDLQNRHYTLSYHRAGLGNTPLNRYIDPSMPMMSWVFGYDDRESVNVCLLYQYIISYEPHHFRGHLEEFPLTLEYGKKIDTLRRRYHEFLWDGDFLDTMGATLEVTGNSPVIYSVFRHKDSGRKAVILVNNGMSPVSVKVNTGWIGSFFAVSPENPDPETVVGKVQLPLRSAVVVIETT